MGRILASLMILSAAVFAGAHDARAQAQPVLVELFTSQGCNSCPPADEYLGTLADRDDVIALSMHVDYWDYLGWRDVFASPAHTKRQRAYAVTMAERMVYTPQIVVQGAEAMVGSHGGKVDDAILRHGAKDPVAQIDLSLRGDRLVADVSSEGEAASGRVVMVWFNRAESVAIRAGENRGREITYHNVVTGWSDLGAFLGGRIAMTAPKPMDADGVAVFIQQGEGGPILAAAKLAMR
ncbi:MAG: DUF1223 domain-containing protein [Pseudomonadota bacterium]